MKKLLFLVLAAVALCCCEKDSDTTGRLVIRLCSQDVPMEARVAILESNTTIHDFVVLNQKTSLRLNPGNYQLRLYSARADSGQTYSVTFQIVAGQTVTFRSTPFGTGELTTF